MVKPPPKSKRKGNKHNAGIDDAPNSRDDTPVLSRELIAPPKNIVPATRTHAIAITSPKGTPNIQRITFTDVRGISDGFIGAGIPADEADWTLSDCPQCGQVMGISCFICSVSVSHVSQVVEAVWMNFP